MPELVTDATITPATDETGAPLSDALQQEKRVTVHFNPETLNITLRNTMQRGRRRQPAQTVTESVGKLSMDLIFDSTTSGEDVRKITHKLAKMMDPVHSLSRRRRQQTNNVPAIVIFEWGTVRFEGYIDKYRESIDFFSTEGVPLRATVSISITQQERTFERVDMDDDQTQALQAQIGRSLDQIAGTSGDPSAARQVAKLNNIENMRFPDRDDIFVFSASAGAGLSISADISMGASVDAGFGITAGSQVGVAANTGSTEKAFSGLHVQNNITLPRPRKKLSAPTTSSSMSSGVGIGTGTRFGIGGQVKSGRDSLSADVGINSDIDKTIRFED